MAAKRNRPKRAGARGRPGVHGAGATPSDPRGLAAAAPAESLRPRDPTWAFGAGLLCLLLWVYQPALTGRFLWDDDAHIPRPGLRSLHGLYRIWFEPGATQQYYPLTESLFWLQYRLWGEATLGYHLLNVGLHALVAVLFLRVLQRLRAPGAYLAAALFALHPVHVESVAWITELKNTLSSALCLGATLVYLRFDETRAPRTYLAAFGL